jgi:hypothetical protein
MRGPGSSICRVHTVVQLWDSMVHSRDTLIRRDFTEESESSTIYKEKMTRQMGWVNERLEDLMTWLAPLRPRLF